MSKYERLSVAVIVAIFVMILVAAMLTWKDDPVEHEQALNILTNVERALARVNKEADLSDYEHGCVRNARDELDCVGAAMLQRLVRQEKA